MAFINGRNVVLSQEDYDAMFPPMGAVVEPVPDTVADYQFAGQAAAEGIISDEAGLAWTARGETPAILLKAAEAVLKDDPERLNRVRYFLAGSKEYPRHHELTPLLGKVLGKDTPEAVDDFYRSAGKR